MELARAGGPHLRRARGQLVLVGSIAGKLGVAHEAAYATAKSGLGGLADSLRSEWAGEVAVTLFSPGVVATPFFERRNQPYLRAWPRPIPAAEAARTLVKGVERRPAEIFRPLWVGPVSWLHGGLPGPYRYFASLAAPARRPPPPLSSPGEAR
jgi:NAD(P)-dependent dehydrogenase (short-subunit alcohol dehydrogenase family)